MRAAEAPAGQRTADSGQREKCREKDQRRLFACCLLSAVCCLASACNKDPDEELQKSTRSWRSSLELAQREHAKHNVPQKYVEQVAKLASENLEKEIENPEVKPETRRDAEKVVEAANKISGEGK